MLKEIKRVAVLSNNKKRIIGFTLQDKINGHWENFCIGFIRLDTVIEWLEDLAIMYPRRRYRIYSALEDLVVYE